MVKNRQLDIEDLLDDGYLIESEEVLKLQQEIQALNKKIEIIDMALQPLDEMSKFIVKIFMSDGSWVTYITSRTYLSEKTLSYLFGDIIDYCISKFNELKNVDS